MLFQDLCHDHNGCSWDWKVTCFALHGKNNRQYRSRIRDRPFDCMTTCTITWWDLSWCVVYWLCTPKWLTDFPSTNRLLSWLFLASYFLLFGTNRTKDLIEMNQLLFDNTFCVWFIQCTVRDLLILYCMYCTVPAGIHSVEWYAGICSAFAFCSFDHLQILSVGK